MVSAIAPKSKSCAFKPCVFDIKRSKTRQKFLMCRLVISEYLPMTSGSLTGKIDKWYSQVVKQKLTKSCVLIINSSGLFVLLPTERPFQACPPNLLLKSSYFFHWQTCGWHPLPSINQTVAIVVTIPILELFRMPKQD